MKPSAQSQLWDTADRRITGHRKVLKVSLCMYLFENIQTKKKKHL